MAAIEYSALQSASLRLAFMIEAEVRQQLADMASIRQYIDFAGDITGSGSDTLKLRLASWGAKQPFASIGEAAEASATSLSYSTASITIGRSALRYDISDLAVMTGLGRDLDPFLLGESMAMSAEARIMELITATFSSASSSVGTTTVDMDVDDFLDAVYQLELTNNNAPFLCCLHPVQFTDLQRSLRSENNNFMAFQAPTAEISKIKGQGYAGSYMGVDIFKSDKCPTANAGEDRVGLMWGRGGLAYGIGTPAPLMAAGAEMRPAGTPVVVSFQRDESKALTEIVGHLYCGAALVEDDRTVKIVTDA